MKYALMVALMFGAASAAAPPSSAPLCRVQAFASPNGLPGMYTVQVATTTTLSGAPCPSDGYALVQLEGGRQYPLTVVTPDMPFQRIGIPWYWVLKWQALSGKFYRVRIQNFTAPFFP